MSQYAIVRHDERMPDEVELDERVRMLEDRLRAMESTVAGWQDQTAGVFEAADRLRDQLAQVRKARELPEHVGETMDDIHAANEEPIVVQSKSYPTPPTGGQTPSGPPTGTSWLVLDIIADVKDMISLTFDSRYKRSWTVGLSVPILIAAFIFIWLFFDVFVVSDAIQLVLALVLFKVMNREVVRYREHIRRRVNLD